MMAAATTIFVYYTTWAILVPFFDASSPIHAWFPPREWAIRLPAFVLVVGLSAIGAFVGSTIIKENRKAGAESKV
ncbi:dolichol phosphate-mannose biosynthesis regulatory, partial [Lactarius hengduanensis]